jgi:hypothetical protein
MSNIVDYDADDGKFLSVRYHVKAQNIRWRVLTTRGVRVL